MISETLQRLLAVPYVPKGDVADLREYGQFIKRLRRAAWAHGAEPTPIPSRKRCGNPECERPGRWYERRETEAASTYIKRRYCGPKCSAHHKGVRRFGKRHAAILALGLTCQLETCGRPLVRREREEWTKFAIRKFCNRECRYRYQTGRPKRLEDRLRLPESASSRSSSRSPARP